MIFVELQVRAVEQILRLKLVRTDWGVAVGWMGLSHFDSGAHPEGHVQYFLCSGADLSTTWRSSCRKKSNDRLSTFDCWGWRSALFGYAMAREQNENGEQ